MPFDMSQVQRGARLRRTPFFSFVAIVTLAFGVGANLFFFQMVNALLLRPHPVPNPETLARFYRACCGRGEPGSISTAVPEPMADFVERHASVLSAVLTTRSVDMAFGLDGKLYITTGDNWNPPSAQLLTTDAGKILRVNLDGTIPTDVMSDLLHPTPKGYEIWAQAVKEPLTALMAGR